MKSRKKHRLSNERLPHFQWELRSYQGCVEKLLEDYPMSSPRNSVAGKSRLKALDCILANQRNGRELILPNFSKIKAEELGFSRSVFLQVLEHLAKVALVGREGEGFARSIITYSSRIRRYLPTKTIFRPPSPVIINLKEEGTTLAKVNTDIRKGLKERLKSIYRFYLNHEISPGIDKETFNLFNQVEVEVYHKPRLLLPDPSKILPNMVFNDRDLTKGGRMYGAFWINEKKLLRRAVTIDGQSTADVDGRAMHVQLLYQLCGKALPPGDPYLFTDDTRSVAKKLMLLMINTKAELPPVKGRQAVARTYKNHFGEYDDIEELILQLEAHHYIIANHFYKPNWGHLQRTEATIILGIMERGMEDQIVILPVHDGCLCTRENTAKVLQYFNEAGIEAVENKEHLQPLPVERAMDLLKAARNYSQCA